MTFVPDNEEFDLDRRLTGILSIIKPTMKKLFVPVLFCALITPCLFGQTQSFNVLNQTLSEHDKSLNRLSSGTLLWTDDPSSRAIYESLAAHINFLSTNINNEQDLISYSDTKGSYLASIGDTLNRIRELILKRSNSFFGDDDREIIESEISTHYSGIMNELFWAEFNTIPMFKTRNEKEEIVDRFQEPSFYTLDGLDRIIQAVISERTRIGALVKTMEQRLKGLAIQNENTMSSLSAGVTDLVVEISNLKRNEILFFSNLFLLKYQAAF